LVPPMTITWSPSSMRVKAWGLVNTYRSPMDRPRACYRYSLNLWLKIVKLIQCYFFVVGFSNQLSFLLVHKLKFLSKLLNVALSQQIF
jgi:hypothetical protein